MLPRTWRTADAVLIDQVVYTHLKAMAAEFTGALDVEKLGFSKIDELVGELPRQLRHRIAQKHLSPASAWGTRVGRPPCGDLDSSPASLPQVLVEDRAVSEVARGVEMELGDLVGPGW